MEIRDVTLGAPAPLPSANGSPLGFRLPAFGARCPPGLRGSLVPALLGRDLGASRITWQIARSRSGRSHRDGTSRSAVDDPLTARLGDRLELRVAVESRQDRSDVISDRRLCEAEASADLLRSNPVAEKLDYLALSRSEHFICVRHGFTVPLVRKRA